MFFSVSILSNHTGSQTRYCYYPFFHSNACYGPHFFSTGPDPIPPDLHGEETAYDILGVQETSSFAEIKNSFHNLAKQTHPDLAASTSSRRFIQILAAYEILSDLERRAHYDQYLLSQRKLVEKQSTRQDKKLYYAYQSRMTSTKQMEVVEWLKWYRLAVNDILAERKVESGTGYLDVLEADFYSAVHAAYYGPVIESLELLPDRFEAEERSVYDTPEVLHLVSGRDMFGMVCFGNRTLELSYPSTRKIESPNSVGSGICRSMANSNVFVDSNREDGGGVSQMSESFCTSDAYRDLELHVCGRVVAVASRVPPEEVHEGVDIEDSYQDKIHVFLSLEDNTMCGSKWSSKYSFVSSASKSRISLGTIVGLGTCPEEGSCFVYDGSDRKTHVIMKHRTLMVKHLHWYDLGDKISVCECRCSRARLPPSRFWLFEPRSGMHDIGGWYVETFGRDKKGRTVPSQRYWDGFDGSEQYEKRLHPAMYLLALAYRSLDLEHARRRKQTVRTYVEGQIFRILQWCKKLV